MIYIESIRNLNKHTDKQNLLIVRSLKTPPKQVHQHVPHLAPSWGLFGDYINLKNNGNWNEQTFNEIYAPRFIKELNIKDINNLTEYGKHTDVVLYCFCEKENMCHRCIIAGILQGIDKNIIACKTDYSKYHDLYMKYKGGDIHAKS